MNLQEKYTIREELKIMIFGHKKLTINIYKILYLHIHNILNKNVSFIIKNLKLRYINKRKII
jgi:hypothetical protein